jgi:hypothetical protein
MVCAYLKDTHQLLRRRLMALGVATTFPALSTDHSGTTTTEEVINELLSAYMHDVCVHQVVLLI